MIGLLKNIDTKLFLFFNSNHTPFMDSVMRFASDRFSWIPLYAVILFFAWRKVQKKIWIVLVAVALLITLSDQISVHLFKERFKRYRPCHNLALQDKVQLIDSNCGGQYGFVSSHAANTFALTTFLILFFRNKYFFFAMYIWAAFVSYSRVYSGVHYPFDVLGGMFLGVLIGIIGYKTYLHYYKKYAY